MIFNSLVENSPNRGLFKRGLYTTYINAYKEAFGADNIHLVIQEELKADQITELAKSMIFRSRFFRRSKSRVRDIFVAGL